MNKMLYRHSPIPNLTNGQETSRLIPPRYIAEGRQTIYRNVKEDFFYRLEALANIIKLGHFWYLNLKTPSSYINRCIDFTTLQRLFRMAKSNIQ